MALSSRQKYVSLNQKKWGLYHAIHCSGGNIGIEIKLLQNGINLFQTAKHEMNYTVRK